ncbi:MAG: SIS domain-containing protein [Rhodospirillaceae bacterium]|nr:SIS domain-containing protein [Rhodospirillaceae bacterium]
MTFPEFCFDSMGLYFDAYAERLARAMASVRRDALEEALAVFSPAIEADHVVYVCGNGGSAAIANHAICDFSHGLTRDTGLHPRVYSLSNAVERLTAVANDTSYADVFVAQLHIFARPGDVLLTISSSGDSENIVRAVAWARDHAVSSVALTGFDGGRTARMADVNVHVDADNYGIVEDVHQSLMHAMMQYMRQCHMPVEKIAPTRF